MRSVKSESRQDMVQPLLEISEIHHDGYVNQPFTSPTSHRVLYKILTLRMLFLGTSTEHCAFSALITLTA